AAYLEGLDLLGPAYVELHVHSRQLLDMILRGESVEGQKCTWPQRLEMLKNLFRRTLERASGALIPARHGADARPMGERHFDAFSGHSFSNSARGNASASSVRPLPVGEVKHLYMAPPPGVPAASQDLGMGGGFPLGRVFAADGQWMPLGQAYTQTNLVGEDDPHYRMSLSLELDKARWKRMVELQRMLYPSRWRVVAEIAAVTCATTGVATGVVGAAYWLCRQGAKLWWRK
ncbi:MAG: hypothetical protein OXT67_07235, partial [Zetaproteobacteria bacterium]|nr:hypothetical protein [Zetaproteobacteria bacterium]